MAKKLIVHNGTMHADDVMTAAILTYFYPDLQVERLPDAKITEEMKNDPDIIIADVGGEYDPSRGLFDHHNPCPLRVDGKSHSALGLILMEDEYKAKIDPLILTKMQPFIDQIEYVDNGQEYDDYDPNGFNIPNFVSFMNPTWNSQADPDERFTEAVKTLRECFVEPMILDGPIKEKTIEVIFDERKAESELALKEAEQIVMPAYMESEYETVVLPQYAPFQEFLYNKIDASYVVFPSNRGGVMLQCVAQEPDSFTVKKELPDWLINKPEGLIFEYGAGDPHKTKFIANFETEQQAKDAAIQALIRWRANRSLSGIHAHEALKALNVKDIPQNNPHHFGSLYEHTEAVTNYLEREMVYNHIYPNRFEALNLAAVYHDIGKVETVKVNEKTGYDQFLGHAERSAEIFRELNKKYGLADDVEYVSELIRLHDTKYSKQGKCQNMLNEHPNGFASDLLALQLSDVMGQSEYQRAEKLQEIENFASLIKTVGSPEQVVGVDDIIALVKAEKEMLPYGRDKFDSYQLGVIRDGFMDGVDASVYANPVYDDSQMRMIKTALMWNVDSPDSPIDVSLIANPECDVKQMRAIYFGLRFNAGWGNDNKDMHIDVTAYSDPKKFTGEQMNEIFEKLCEEQHSKLHTVRIEDVRESAEKELKSELINTAENSSKCSNKEYDEIEYLCPCAGIPCRMNSYSEFLYR